MPENAFLWSVTAADNATADPAVPWVENMLPGAVNNVARATMAAVARLVKDLNGSVTTGGSANAYTVTSNSGHTAYANGILITAKASFTNTSAATLNLNTYGAKDIKVFVGGAEADVAAGQIISGCTYQFRYDTALDSATGAWLLLNPSPDPSTIIQIGDVKLWTSDTLPTGRYLWCNGQTIGNASSGGTALASAEASALFLHLYGAYSNAELPVSGGRGASAAADFAANKTITLLDYRGRAPFGSDDMATSAANRITNAKSGIVGTTLGANGGLEDHTLTTAQTPSHTHSGTTSGNGAHTHTATTDTENTGTTHLYDRTTGNTFNAAGGGVSVIASLNQTSTATSGANVAHTHGISTTSDPGNHTHTITTDGGTGGGAAHNNMPPALITNFIIRY